MRSIFIIFLTFVVIIIMSGCRLSTAKPHNTKIMVFGFGLITIDKDPCHGFVSDTKTVGVQISNAPGLKLGLGYSENTVIGVPANSDNLIIEVAKPSNAPLLVRSTKYQSERTTSESY